MDNSHRHFDPAEYETHPSIIIRWWMPNGVFSRPLNTGKRSEVFKTIIREAVQYGRCKLPVEKIAELSMCDASTVRATLKIGLDANLISIDAADKTIFLDPDWLVYLRKVYPKASRELWF